MPTDYAPIAAVYDQSAFRQHNPPDPELARLAEAGPVAALDVACGTGSYLLSQHRAFGERVRLAGVDRSPAMLAVARAKLPELPLALCRAEALPVPSGRFALVSCRFAFHHFEDKAAALDELCRACAKGGSVVIANIAPEHMPESWLYRAFPGAFAIDQHRFWPATLLAHELERRGLEVTLTIELERKRLPLALALEEARRRDASQLAVMAEAEYREGLARLEREHAAEPGRRVLTEQAILRCIARR